MACAALLIPDVTRDKLNRCFEKIIKRALEFSQAYLVEEKSYITKLFSQE